MEVKDVANENINTGAQRKKQSREREGDMVSDIEKTTEWQNVIKGRVKERDVGIRLPWMRRHSSVNSTLSN